MEKFRMHEELSANTSKMRVRSIWIYSKFKRKMDAKEVYKVQSIALFPGNVSPISLKRIYVQMNSCVRRHPIFHRTKRALVDQLVQFRCFWLFINSIDCWFDHAECRFRRQRTHVQMIQPVCRETRFIRSVQCLFVVLLYLWHLSHRGIKWGLLLIQLIHRTTSSESLEIHIKYNTIIKLYFPFLVLSALFTGSQHHC